MMETKIHPRSVSRFIVDTDQSAKAPALPRTIIEPRRQLLSLDLRSIWEYRELLYFLIWRDIKIRYKQTLIGAAWAVLQPLTSMLIFTVIFGAFARIPSDGLPYPVFSFTGLLPWILFATALTRSTESVVGNSNLVSKVYFPRLTLPIAGTLSGTIDFAISLLILLGMMVWFHILPTWRILLLPGFVLLALSTALAVGLWSSALNVRYRDVGHTIPFLVQVWMYASPVVYPVSIIPRKWQLLYSLNPMVGVIEGFRWTLAGSSRPDFTVIGISAAMVLALLVSGLIYFKHTERTFADVV